MRLGSPLVTHSWSKYMLVDFDFWPDYLSKGRKYLTGLGEVSMTELFLGKVCFPLEQGHRCLTQCKIFSQPVLPARCQPAYSLYQEMCFLNQLSLCQTISSVRTGCLLYTPLFPQGPVLPLAYGDQPVLPTPKHFSTVTAQKFLKGCIWLSPTPHLPSPGTSLSSSSQSFVSYIHQHPGSLLGLKGCDCPIS